jgi:hypothetical protein
LKALGAAVACSALGAELRDVPTERAAVSGVVYVIKLDGSRCLCEEGVGGARRRRPTFAPGDHGPNRHR